MSRPVILVDGLSKAYRIGQKADPHASFRDAIVGAVTAPFRKWGRPGGDGASADDTFWALKDVSFEVNQGEVVGVIGRNGAGKSTLLKILSRITEPTSGEVRLRGRVASLLEVGTGFHPELTGRENVYLNGAILGMKRAEIDRKFDEIVAFAEIEQFLDTPVKRYSSGMYVRLAFSVAAHLEPEILIVDEVLAVGDSEFQSKCLGKMDNIARGGRTIFFVSHNMAAVQNLCNKAILLKTGKIESDGECQHVLEKYMKSNQNDGAQAPLELSRVHGMLPIIRQVQLSDLEFDNITLFRSGHPFSVSIHYDSPVSLRDPRFGIIVESAAGGRLFFLQTLFQHGAIDNLPGRGVLNCTVPSLPLVPGSYSLTIGCSSAGQQLDLIERGVRFSVEGADFYHTGRLPPVSHGHFLVNAEWSLPHVQS